MTSMITATDLHRQADRESRAANKAGAAAINPTHPGFANMRAGSPLPLWSTGGSDADHGCSHEKQQPAVSGNTRLQRNATSHADRHGHGCPSAPAMQHSGGADVTVALHR